MLNRESVLHNFPQPKGDTFKLCFVCVTVQKSKANHLTKKTLKFSHLRSWNQFGQERSSYVTNVIKQIPAERKKQYGGFIYELLPFPALPTETLYVGSPPWLFVLMSIVQSPSSWRLSLRTEHFFEPRVRPLV